MEFLGNDKRVIGKFQLDDYQADAIKNIYNCSYNILSKKSKEQILLHAPVGSGKTVMGAFAVNFFKRQMNELGYNEHISFIWISPDTGGINEQSKDSFLDILQDVRVLDIQQGKTENEIPEDTILFVNWEKLTKDANLMKKDTEETVFRDILKNTKTKKVLIIDEAHIDWTSNKDSEVLEIIDPDLTINLTATPDKRLLDRVAEDHMIYISYKTVQDAGVIKDRIIVNDTLDKDINYEENQNRTSNNKIPLLDVEQLLLEKAIEKREYLEVLNRQINKDVFLKPLVLIQIPNANALENISKEYVYTYLRSKGIDETKTGIWLSNTKQNIDNLRNSGVEYLITKQAVATGWDCPRAHILVKLRETGSVNFDIQTLGRVMRIPRGLDYSNPDLKSAYIYSPHETFGYRGAISNSEKRSIEELTKEKNKAKIKDSFKKTIGLMGVPMYKRIRTKDTFLTNDSLYNFLETSIVKGNFVFKTSATIEIKSKEIIEDINIEESFELEDSVIVKELTLFELKHQYMSSVSSVYNLINLEPYISKILYKVLIKDDEKRKNLSYSDLYELIYRLFHNNKDSILFNIKNAIKLYEHDDNILKSSENDYIIQEEIYLGEVKDNTDDKYSYDQEPNLEHDSEPEEKFQINLNRNKNIKYWFKNGTGQNDFSIVYEDKGLLKEYYPDFIIFDYDKNIYILDTKSNFEDEDFRTTGAKYNAGRQYIKKDNVISRFKDLGFNEITFSMIKYAGGGTVPFILNKDLYTNELNNWEMFEVSTNKK